MKTIETIIDRFDGGISNDPRDTSPYVCRMITGFDVISCPRKLVPYRDTEAGSSGYSAREQKNFCIAYYKGVNPDVWVLLALGRQESLAKPEILYKDLTTGGSNDLDDSGWSTPAVNQSATVEKESGYNLFLYYHKVGKAYLGATDKVVCFNLDGSTAFDDTGAGTDGIAYAYTNMAQGLVHSKDDIAYIALNNLIYKKDNTAAWALSLTLPSHCYITSLCEYGNYLAIATASLSGVGDSVVYLWDRDTSLATLAESINWGRGILKVLEEQDGVLIGISVVGGSSTALKNKVIFKVYSGGGAVKIKEIDSTTTPDLPIAKQKYNNRVYFMMGVMVGGTKRDGLWSIGRTPDGGYSLIHEITPNNGTALSNGIMKNFCVVGDYFFLAYQDTDYYMTKTNDQAVYTATAIFETKVFGAEGRSKVKKLVGVSVSTEPLPTAGQVVLKYQTDTNIGTSTWTTIFTNTTDNSVSHSAVNIESTGASFPEYKEIAFRIESTGGAIITELSFKETVVGKRNYE